MSKVIIIFLFGVITITSCRKEKFNERNNTPLNTTPKAFAGDDIQLTLPLDSCLLRGSAIDAENNIQSYLWRKISGPGSHQFQNSNSAVTQMYWLERGIYDFELRVTDSKGLSGKDTVSVYVNEPAPGPNEKIFKDVQWSCPFGCSMEINNFYSFIPTTTFKVYIKSQNSNIWIQVIHERQGTAIDKYSYGLYNNQLQIWTYDDQSLVKWDVKISY